MELNSAKANLIKDSIRMGHIDLGDHFYKRGDLNSSLKCYARARDYCATQTHTIEMCLSVIRVCIETENYGHVLSYISKAESCETNDKIVQAKLKCCSALAQLDGKKNKLAARKFIETNFDIGNKFSDVIAQQDIAIYGGLCALVSFERSELKSLIDHVQFKSFLELVPEIRDLILDFYHSRYASCLKHLDKMKTDLLLDIYLHDHVPFLYEKNPK